jgi:hypothetical protein
LTQSGQRYHASADDQVTGVLLVTITKANGTVDTDKYNNGALSERSTCATIGLAVEADHDAGDTVKLNINYNGAGNVAYQYTNTADAGDEFAVRNMLVIWLNRTCPFLKATASDVDDLVILVRPTIAGDTLAITDNGGDITITPDIGIVTARSNCIYFAPPSAGAMSKASETWSGEVQVSGVAGYFRIVQPEDDGTDSNTQIRLQGDISTSGAELNMANTSLVAAETHTVDSYSISLPAE